MGLFQLCGGRTVSCHMADVKQAPGSLGMPGDGMHLFMACGTEPGDLAISCVAQLNACSRRGPHHCASCGKVSVQLCEHRGGQPASNIRREFAGASSTWQNCVMPKTLTMGFQRPLSFAWILPGCRLIPHMLLSSENEFTQSQNLLVFCFLLCLGLGAWS